MPEHYHTCGELEYRTRVNRKNCQNALFFLWPAPHPLLSVSVRACAAAAVRSEPHADVHQPGRWQMSSFSLRTN